MEVKSVKPAWGSGGVENLSEPEVKPALGKNLSEPACPWKIRGWWVLQRCDSASPFHPGWDDGDAGSSPRV